MQHWVVTHNPHPIPDTHGWNVYFRKLPSRIPAIDDLVFFYETQTTFPGRDRPGEKAIVRLARVSGTPCPISGIEPWVYQVPCITLRECFLPLAKASEIIKRPYFYRNNLTPISEMEYNEIEEECEAMRGHAAPPKGQKISN